MLKTSLIPSDISQIYLRKEFNQRCHKSACAYYQLLIMLFVRIPQNCITLLQFY